MTTTTKHITAEQLLEGGYDHCELIAGEIVRMAPAYFEHGDIAMAIGGPMRVFVDQQKLGRVLSAEAGFIISRGPDTVLAPDVSFVRRTRVPKGRRTFFFEGAPDLAVEVMSPSDRISQVRAKAARWIAAGAEAVWVVNPSKRAIEVHRAGSAIQQFSGGDILRDESLLPGFSVDVTSVFAE
jgi:Uma2 family endonuclease